MGKNRKVHFFKLSAVKIIFDKNNKKREDTIEDDGSLLLLDEFYNTMSTTKTGSRIKRYSNTNNEDFLLEIIEYNKKYIFAKVARENLHGTVGIRDKQTYISSAIPVKPEQTLETFTYFYIDLSNMIISILGIGGAPRVSVFKYILNNYYLAKNIRFETSAILSKDIVSIISNKDVISKVEFTYATPSNSICAEDLKLDESEFKSAAKKKYMKQQVTISTREKHGIYGKLPNGIKSWYSKTVDEYGEQLSKFQVSARNYDEKTNYYNLLEYSFTESVEIEDIEKYKENDFKETIIKVYTYKKKELENNLQ